MRFNRDLPRPRGWRRLVSSTWLRLECQEGIQGDSVDLMYSSEIDYVFHIHDSFSFRAIKVKKTKEGYRVTLPGVTYEVLDNGSLNISGVSAQRIETPNLSFYPPATPVKRKSFQRIDDVERIRSALEAQGTGMTRRELALELEMTEARVRKAVKSLLSSNERFFEDGGRKISVRSEITPKWWRSLKEDL